MKSFLILITGIIFGVRGEYFPVWEGNMTDQELQSNFTDTLLNCTIFGDFEEYKDSYINYSCQLTNNSEVCEMSDCMLYVGCESTCYEYYYVFKLCLVFNNSVSTTYIRSPEFRNCTEMGPTTPSSTSTTAAPPTPPPSTTPPPTTPPTTTPPPTPPSTTPPTTTPPTTTAATTTTKEVTTTSSTTEPTPGETTTRTTTNRPTTMVNEAALDGLSNIASNLLKMDGETTADELQNFTRSFSRFLRNATEPLNYTNSEFHVQIDFVNAFEDESIRTENNIAIDIPSSALQIVLNDENDGRQTNLTQDVIVVVIHYLNSNFFPSNRNVSQIISLDIGSNLAAPLENLKDPVALSFTGKSLPRRNLQCVFWNYSMEDWSTFGCELDLDLPLTCRCNHTTNFALLINPDADDDLALTIISIVGLALSIFGLSITLIIHLVYKDLRKRRPARVLMHICFNLLVGYVIYVAGIYASGIQNLCLAITFLLHFFFLAAWGWMSVYSYDMYISLVKVFDTHQSFFLRKFGSIAYGMALIISIITISVGISADYKYEEFTHYKSKKICWLYNESLYYGFILPIGIMFLFNMIVFIMVFREIVGQSKVISSATKHTAKQQLLIAITMTSFTGLAWVFAFLLVATSVADRSTDGDGRNSDDTAYTTAFNWLFAIFNCLQGFGIFLLTAVKRKETRRLWWTPIKSKFSDVMPSLSTKSSSYSVSGDGDKDATLKITTIGDTSHSQNTTEQNLYVISAELKSVDEDL